MKENSPRNDENESFLKTTVVVVVTLVALVFLVARPFLNLDDETKQESTADNSEKKKNSTATANSDAKDKSKAEPSIEPKKNGQAAKKSEVQQANQADSNRNQNNNPTSSKKKKSNAPRGPPSTTTQKFTGKLTKVSADLWKSESGLIYGPGSREGHRLDHVLKHSKDDLSKPVHGVFDGTKEEIIALIDQAYDRVKKDHRSVSESMTGKRTVYSVYFGKRIGHVGGKSGKQKRNPIAKTLVLVLEEDRVITAYPK